MCSVFLIQKMFTDRLPRGPGTKNAHTVLSLNDQLAWGWGEARGNQYPQRAAASALEELGLAGVRWEKRLQ